MIGAGTAYGRAFWPNLWGGVYNQVQQSEEWQLRDHVEPAMIDAVLDLQQRCLEAFAQLDGVRV